ncbi:carbonic anhydrase 14-like, partial [Scyliorhinus canicula]|uniref:carbonic anhydrase 14-like n=1 Tax=Scyliorhinus canicula TaxID=7830 RepID=UPI0018F4FF4C
MPEEARECWRSGRRSQQTPDPLCLSLSPDPARAAWRMLPAIRDLALCSVLTLLSGMTQVHRGAGASSWTYEGSHGPENWGKDYPHCGGGAQSPIDIDTAVVNFDPSLPALQLSGYRIPDRPSFTLSNNGHT